MTIPLEKILEEAFSDISSLTPEKMQAVITETVRVMSELEQKMNSKNPKDKEEALKAAQNLKDAFEVQTKMICEKAGIDPLKFSVYAEEMMMAPGPIETVIPREQPAAKKLKPKMKG